MVKYAIVIPAYKAADTIAETLDSIAACQPEIQEAIAVIVVDDCSPDQQVEVARAAWKLTLPPLIVIQSDKNEGQWKSLNKGIEMASNMGAKWVFILHADDLAKEVWLNQILVTLNKASQMEIGSVCSSYDTLYSNGNVAFGEDKINRAVEMIPATSKSIHDTLLMGCWWHISGCLVSIEAYRQVGGFNGAYYALADWDWILRLFNSKKWGIAYIPRTLIYYRQHANTITAQTIRTTARVEEQIEIVSRFAPYLSRMDHLRWHGQQFYFTVRRMGRDMVTGNTKGLKSNGRTFGLLLQSLFQQLIGQRK